MDIKKAKNRRDYTKKWKTEQRHKLRKEHKCIWCKIKVKPKVKYPQFCEEHNQKNRRLKNEN